MFDWYEKHKLYRANPCDSWAYRPLRFLGRVVSKFGSSCSCCGGVRVIAAAVLATYIPPAITLQILSVWWIIAVLSVLFEKDPDA